MKKYSKWCWKKGDDGIFRPVAICTMCGKEFANGNVNASCYCPDCSNVFKRDKTRERVRKYRERQKRLVSTNGEP